MLDELNQQQIEAVTIKNSHALVLAGAGSGKTRTIINRIAHLLETGVNPTKILVLTFTRRAAQEIVDRLNTNYSETVRAGTFHRFCLSAIRAYPTFFKNITSSTIIDRDDQVNLMKICRTSILNRLGKNNPENHDNQLLLDFPKVSALVNFLSYSRSTELHIQKYLEKFRVTESQMVQEAIIELLADYQRLKQEKNYLDFDDILILFLENLEKNPAAKTKFKNLYDHVLVDEVQDTNIIQWRILECLIDPARLYCVGDNAQNIYSFRGALAGNLQIFSKRIKDSQILKLNINYRSTQAILDLANHLLEQSSFNYDKKLVTVKSQGEKPLVKDFYTSDREAGWIVSDIAKRIANSDLQFSDIMILTRSAWPARTMEALLIENKLPYRFIGGASLLHLAHIKDILAVCRSGINLHDDLAWMRWLCLFPTIGPKKALQTIDAIRCATNEAEVLACINKHLPNQEIICSCFSAVLQKKHQPAALLENLSLLLDPVLSKLYDKWENRKRDWQLLAKLAQRFKSTESFIESYTLDPVSVSTAENEDKSIITISTIHSAKGLEARLCYIIQAQSGAFPHINAISKEEIEEERRVLYVAVTRAKDELIITRQIDLSNKFDLSFKNKVYFLEDIEKKLGIVNYQKPSFSASAGNKTIFAFK